MTRSSPAALARRTISGTAATVAERSRACSETGSSHPSCRSTTSPDRRSRSASRMSVVEQPGVQSRGSRVHSHDRTRDSAAAVAEGDPTSPIGGRNSGTGMPAAASTARRPRRYSLSSPAKLSPAGSGWLQEWEPTACPSRSIRATSAGCRSALRPTRKNVAGTARSASRSSSAGVKRGSGPSSKVSATWAPPAGSRWETRATRSGAARTREVTGASRDRTRETAPSPRLTAQHPRRRPGLRPAGPPLGRPARAVVGYRDRPCRRARTGRPPARR